VRALFAENKVRFARAEQLWHVHLPSWCICLRIYGGSQTDRHTKARACLWDV